MIGEIMDQKEIIFGEQKYIIYLKEVATRVGAGGIPQRSVIRAFVKKV